MHIFVYSGNLYNTVAFIKIAHFLIVRNVINHALSPIKLTLVLLNCFNCIFRHLKLELLTQFPASNDEKYRYFSKIYIFQIELFD